MWQLWDEASQQANMSYLPMSPPDGTISIGDEDETTESYTLTNMSEDDDVDEEDDKMFYEDAEMLAKKEEEVKMLLETDPDFDSWLEQLRYQRQLKEKKLALSRLSRSLSAFPPTEPYNLNPTINRNPAANGSIPHRNNNYFTEKPPPTPIHSPSASYSTLATPSQASSFYTYNKIQQTPFSSNSTHNHFNVSQHSSQLRTSAFSCPTSPSNSYTSLPNPFGENGHGAHHKTYHSPSAIPALHNTRAKYTTQRSESACRYFATNGHCRNGANCLFRHVTPSSTTKKGKALFRDSNDDHSTLLGSAYPTSCQKQPSSSEPRNSGADGIEIPEQLSTSSAPSSPRGPSSSAASSSSAPNSPSKHAVSTSPPSLQTSRKAGLPSIVCKFYSVGKCRKGDSCPFVHHTTQRYQLKAKPSSSQAPGTITSEDVINALEIERAEDDLQQEKTRSPQIFTIVIPANQENTTKCLNAFQPEVMTWDNDSWKATVPQTMEAIKSM